jgi:hypothetical protein
MMMNGRRIAVAVATKTRMASLVEWRSSSAMYRLKEKKDEEDYGKTEND